LPNFSLGAWYYTERVFFGISLPRFLGHTEDPSSGKPVITSNPGEFNVLVTGGTTLNLGGGFNLSTSALLKAIPGHELQADFLLLAGWYDQFHAGLGYRTGNSMIGMLNIRINPQFTLLYSYDFVLNRSNSLKSGSHEFSLRYTFSYIHKVTNPRQF
jgi:type IX secretion system PorP/SprF family membrane protein